MSFPQKTICWDDMAESRILDKFIMDYGNKNNVQILQILSAKILQN